MLAEVYMILVQSLSKLKLEVNQEKVSSLRCYHAICFPEYLSPR